MNFGLSIENYRRPYACRHHGIFHPRLKILSHGEAMWQRGKSMSLLCRLEMGS